MFNLVADALAHILNRAKSQGLIKGVVSHLEEGGITHIQYANDTIIMTEGDANSVKNIKFLLLLRMDVRPED